MCWQKLFTDHWLLPNGRLGTVFQSSILQSHGNYLCADKYRDGNVPGC